MNRSLGTIITQTPFRISFFGGGTDFPAYFNRHQGSILGTTINKYTYVTVNSLERLLEKKIRMSYSKLELVDRPEELDHKIVRAALMHHRDLLNGGFLDIHSFADLPSGSGVGSSSSFTVGFLNALFLLNKIYRSPAEIAREAVFIEREIIQEAGGWQDQIQAAYGGFNRIDFHSNDFFVTPVCLPVEKLRALESSCMFFFTGIVRSSAAVHEEDSNLRKVDELDKASFLHSIQKCVPQAMEILSASRDTREMVAEFGQLLNYAWQLKRKASPSASNATLDEIYKAAIDAGAYGGKLVGAGAGGFMVFIVAHDRQDQIAAALSTLKRIHVSFEKNGSRAIFAN